MDTNLVRDFIARYEQGDPTQGYSAEEARSAFERAAEVAPPETLRRAAEQAVDRLDGDQQAEFRRLVRDQVPSAARPQGQGGFGLDDLIAALLGTGSGGAGRAEPVYRQRGATTARPVATVSDLGKILASPVGRAVIGGIGAFAFKELMRSRH